MIISNSTETDKINAVVGRLTTTKHEHDYILCYSAENDQSLFYLSKLGYSHLYGIGPNKRICDMPGYTKIKYAYSQLDNTHYPDCFFDVVYNVRPELLSDIENIKKFINESRRILSDKGTLLFPLTYAKNSKTKSDIGGIIEYASKLGFEEAKKLEFPDNDCTVFLDFRLSKNTKAKDVKEINIIAPSLGSGDGVEIHAENTKSRLKEFGIKANIYKGYEEADKNLITIFEYVPAFNLKFPETGRYIIDGCQTQSPVRFWMEVSNIFKSVARNPKDIFRIMGILVFHFNYSIQTVDRLKTYDNNELEKHFLMLRSNELAEISGFKNYKLMELPSFGEPIKVDAKDKELNIGSFGFATKSKNFDEVCELAKRLDIKATIMLGASKANKVTEDATNELANEIYKRYNSDKISVRVGYYTQEQLIDGMKNCTHFVSAQSDALTASGSLRHMIKLGRPVISVDTYIARDAQVHRVKSLNQITKDYLMNTKELTNLDDGLRYLIKILQYSEI